MDVTSTIMRSAANLVGSDVTGLYPWGEGEMDEVRGWSSSLEILRDRHDPIPIRLGIQQESCQIGINSLQLRENALTNELERVKVDL